MSEGWRIRACSDNEIENCNSISVQLQEFDEDVVITLQAKNPQAPQNIVRFDYTVGEFIPIKLGETMIDHLEIEVGGAFLGAKSFILIKKWISLAVNLPARRVSGGKEANTTGRRRKKR